MKKLVLFGDSLFAQVGKDRVAMFENALPGYDVYNCAVGGWNTNDCVRKAPYVARLEPDVVVISLGTNDANPMKQVPLETFSNNIPKIVESFSPSRVVWFLPTPIDEVKAKIDGWELTNVIVKEYHDAAKKACEDIGVAAIDSFTVFKPLLDSGEEYHNEDGVHFIDTAYQIITSELSELLDQS